MKMLNIEEYKKFKEWASNLSDKKSDEIWNWCLDNTKTTIDYYLENVQNTVIYAINNKVYK